jgi:hypothetical protein
MQVKTLRRITGTIVFLFSAIILYQTVQPSVSLWDPGEISTASFSLMVPHPPGAPLWLLIGRLFSIIPSAQNIGLRINYVSVLAGAFSVLLLFLIAVKLIETYRGKKYENKREAILTYIPSAIGALSLSFCDTFWFNAVEANYFSLSLLLFALVVWLMMLWHEHSEEYGNERYIILTAYLTGLAFGVHLMSVLAIFAFTFVVVMKKYITDDAAFKKTAYLFLIHLGIIFIIACGLWSSQALSSPPSVEQFKAFDSKFIWIMVIASALFMAVFYKQIFQKNSFYLPLIIAAIVLLLTYPGVIKGIPALLLLFGGADISTNILIFVFILGIITYAIYWSAKNKKGAINLAATSLLFMILGFTTYTTIIIRSNQNTPLNENQPDNFNQLMFYIDRGQYGDFPIFDRRWSNQPEQQQIYSNYNSDLDFFLKYQMDHMFNRYLFWNFIGKESSDRDAGVNWGQLYGIPFFIGIAGLFFLFRKNWKMASVWVILFVFMGYMIAFYQNQQQPQPRDRFYFYPGAFFIFSIWIAVGIKEITELVREKLKNITASRAAVFACLALGLFMIPGNMLRTNYFAHDRSKNWVPWDSAYNILQSCEPNAILFTEGDNDTFPLWYLQNVEGVRRDIRVVCLSLANTDWYVKQLKNTSPYGTPKIKFSISDDDISRSSQSYIDWRAHIESVPVSKQDIGNFNITDTSVINSSKISWNMEPTVHYGDMQAIRMQDLVVKEIVENNSWERPVYFATTCIRESYIGLDDYLRLEGLAYRVMPEKRKGVSYVNVALTRENLFNENPGYSKTYKRGFKFRGLNNKEIFFDEQERRLVNNYRMNSFYALAYNYLYDLHDNKSCIETLNLMEKRIPWSVIDTDYRFLYNVGNLYFAAGANDKFKEIANAVEKTAIQNLNVSAYDMQSPFNSYSMLEKIYINLKEYDKAIRLLQKLQNENPDIRNIQPEIERLKKMKQIEYSLK